jgi:hypothetical protein
MLPVRCCVVHVVHHHTEAFVRLQYKTLAVLGIVGGLLAWLHFKRPIPSATLPVGRTNEEALHLPDYGHGNIITVKRTSKGNVTTVTPKATGFPFDIGASGAFGGGYSELYLTTEVFYYRHCELLTGLGVSYPVVHPRVMLALGYRLPWKRVDNISFFAGYNTQYPIVGVYARFGSN